MDRRKPLLVNIGEVETDSVLREVAEKLGVRVFAKPRLADVLRIDSSGLSNDEFGYALKAHLDFVITDEHGKPHFAVEFDGPSHEAEDARRRDAMKDSICERLGLPLLRVDADYLQTVKGYRLLAWLVEIWFLSETWYEAQESGQIPWDEPFVPQSIFQIDGRGSLHFEYDLAGDARRSIWKAHAEGRCLKISPSYVYRTTDVGGEAHAAMPVPGDRWLVSSARIRGFRFDAGVSPGEIAADLVVVDVATKLDEFERGAAVAVSREQVDELFREKKLGSGWSGSV